MGLLCFCSVLCSLCLCACLFICALWSSAGKGLTSWLSFVVSNCEFVTFPLVSWVRWYLIVSIPDLCTLTYFVSKSKYLFLHISHKYFFIFFEGGGGEQGFLDTTFQIDSSKY